jgi:putative PIN family toxin of toxin-antitoxin system
MTSSKLRSAVVDTNLFVSGLIIASRNPFALLEALREGAFLLVMSDDLLIEVTDVLHRPHFEVRYGIVSDARVDNLLAPIAAQARFVTP